MSLDRASRASKASFEDRPDGIVLPLEGPGAPVAEVDGLDDSARTADGPPVDRGGRSDRRRRSQLSVLRTMFRGELGVFPPLVLLGLLSAFAESLGIGLVVLLLYTVLPTDVEPEFGAAFDSILRFVSPEGTPAGLGLVLGLSSLIILRGLTSFSYTVVASRARNRCIEVKRNELHERLLTGPFEQHQREDRGDLLYRLTPAVWECGEVFSALSRVPINLCSMLVFVAALAFLAWPLLATAAVGSTGLFLLLRWLSGRARRIGHEAAAANEELSHRTLESIQNQRTLRILRLERRHHARFLTSSGRVRDAFYRLDCMLGSINPITEVGYLAFLAMILFVANTLGIASATILAFVALLYRLQPHVREFERNLMTVSQKEGALLRLVEVLDGPNDERLDDRATIERSLATDPPEIAFQEVTFEFQGLNRPTLDAVSFVLPKGRATALVGASGAGKSTVVNLLLGLYHPTSGAILVDGEEVASLSNDEWLATVAASGQDIELFDGSIEENIRLARRDADRDDLDRAVAISGLAKVLGDLPKGLQTRVGSQGTNLSGGQRQCVGLARALLRDPTFLILDEAANAVDMELRKQIEDRVFREYKERTLLVITHKLDDLERYDHVVVLESGRVVAEGTPRMMRKDYQHAVRMLS